LQDFHGFRVRNAGKGRSHHALEAFNEALVHKAVKELEVGFAVGEGVFDHVPGKAFAQFHEVLQVGKGHFRLDHPELGGVARRIGIFGAEGGAECVHAPKAHGKGLGLKLAGNSQVALAAKKIGGHILVAGFQAGDAEHFARAFAVRPGEHRRMHP